MKDVNFEQLDLKKALFDRIGGNDRQGLSSEIQTRSKRRCCLKANPPQTLLPGILEPGLAGGQRGRPFFGRKQKRGKRESGDHQLKPRLPQNCLPYRRQLNPLHFLGRKIH